MRSIRRPFVIAVVGIGLTVVAAPTAAAHVTVRPSSEPAGTTYSVLTFRVPNEREDAATVKVDVVFPASTPVSGVLVRPVPGWQVRSKGSRITWRGGRIPVGGYQDFDVSVSKVPDQPGPLVFKALQTYSDGKVVRWIETAPEGSPEPEHPAPTVQLTSPRPAESASGSSNRADRSLAIAALAVAVVALWGAIAGRLRRSTGRD
jgi:uncharacterized protein YcnI